MICHEIGHAIGLGHAANKSSIMYSLIGWRTENVTLGTDDIAGVRQLYGPPIEGDEEEVWHEKIAIICFPINDSELLLVAGF